VAAILSLAHVGVLAVLGTAASGPLLSDLIQLSLGGVLIFACLRSSQRSEGIARSFWRLAAVAYVLWLVAQGMGVYSDLVASPRSVQWATNLLFCFWFVPLALAMFLDPDNEAGGLDSIVALDFVQAVMVCVAAYLYFFYIPKTHSGGKLSHTVWEPYFVGYSFVTGAFLWRAAITQSRVARALFGRFGIFLALSGVVDAMYSYGPGENLQTGAWFDILWTIVLLIPLLIAITWNQTEGPNSSADPVGHEKRIHTELFFLLYPLMVLFMSVGIAREHLGLAALVVLFSFVCSSARLLVTQSRLVHAQEALRREASRDSLTGLWNRKAILDILQRELLRSERHGEPVGIIMADVDHFKAINDSRGHAAGDLVLGIIASEIAAVVRPYDSVGRYGGEEFLIVAPDCSESETWELAERIRSYVASCNIVAGGSAVMVTLSLGIITGNSASDAEKLLHAADIALYQAKNAGRNRVEPTVGHAAEVSHGSAPIPQRDFWL
jgi:diguanylate cyclase (GGDEF)-like protein